MKNKITIRSYNETNAPFLAAIYFHTIHKIRKWRLRKSADEEKSKENPRPLADIKPFTIHDLRRSAAACWGMYLKTISHVIEHILNHQPLNKLVATYQRAVYADEQKDAWLA